MSAASSYPPFSKWRSKHGDMDTAKISRRKELEAEITRLNKIVAEERFKA